MKTSDSVLFDTNILVYNQVLDCPQYQAAKTWHHKATNSQITVSLSTQNLLEFSAVMVNPAKIVKPLTQTQTAAEIKKYLSHPQFHLISPNSQTLIQYSHLLKQYPHQHPRQLFDMFLVATMLSYNLHTIITANTKDFKIYKQITTVSL